MSRPVVLIADSEFGEGIAKFVSFADVWAIESPTNKAAREALRNSSGSVSGFYRFGDSLDEWLSSALDMIEEHHGVGYQVPPYNKLIIVGAIPGPHLIEGLQYYGFTESSTSESGIVFSRSTTSS